MSALAYAPYALAAWLVVIGLYGVITSRNLVHLIVCLSVVQSATYVTLLMVGYVAGGAAPVYYHIALGTKAVDPVVQALMLTDVVVEVTVLALLLSIAVQVHKQHKTLDPNRLGIIRG